MLKLITFCNSFALLLLKSSKSSSSHEAGYFSEAHNLTSDTVNEVKRIIIFDVLFWMRNVSKIYYYFGCHRCF